MKKKKLKGLRLNKEKISSFTLNSIVGGTGQSFDMTCTGMVTCGNCTVGTSGTLEGECEPNNDDGPSRRRCIQ